MYLFGRCSPGEIAPTFTERFGIGCGGCDRERFAAQNRREASMFRSILAVLVILTTPALALDQPPAGRAPGSRPGPADSLARPRHVMRVLAHAPRQHSAPIPA